MINLKNIRLSGGFVFNICQNMALWYKGPTASGNALFTTGLPCFTGLAGCFPKAIIVANGNSHVADVNQRFR